MNQSSALFSLALPSCPDELTDLNMLGEDQAFHKLGVEVGGLLGKDVTGFYDLLDMLNRRRVEQESTLEGLFIGHLDGVSVMTYVFKIGLLGKLPFTDSQEMTKYHDLQNGDIQLLPGLSFVRGPGDSVCGVPVEFEQNKFMQGGKIEPECITTGELLLSQGFHENFQDRQLLV